MIDAFFIDAAWIDVVCAFGIRVAIRATLLLGLAAELHAVLGSRRALARSAVWNACLAGLLILPVATAVFPRVRIACLPAGVQTVLDAGMRPGGVEGFGRTAAETTETPGDLAPPAAQQAVGMPVFGMPPGREEHEAGGGARSLDVPRDPTSESRTSGDGAGPAAGSGRDGSVDWAALLVLTYVLGVLVMAVRLIGSLIAVRRLRGGALAIRDRSWVDALDRWRRRLGIRRRVDVKHTEQVNVPLALGWIRPVILLPSSMIDAGSANHRDAVLLHELAHLRRADYFWAIVFRCVQAVYWAHPLAWLGGRMATALREQACDDLCVHHISGPTPYRTTLIEVAAAMIGRRPVTTGTAMARSSKIARRLGRIDRGHRAARCLAPSSVRAAVALLAVMIAGVLGPAELARRHALAASPPPTSAPATGPDRTDPRSLNLRVIHRDTREPVGGVELEVVVNREERTLTTDDAGRARIDLPATELTRVDVRTRKPGLAPMFVKWDKPRTGGKLLLPKAVTIELQPGRSIGGIIQDEQGEPIEGVTVRVSVRGCRSTIPQGEPCVYLHRTFETDRQGRWRCEDVPELLEDIQLSLDLSHPDFPRQGIGGRALREESDNLRNMTSVQVMKNDGVTLRGRVLDAQGRPIEGATVTASARVWPGSPSAMTDADGHCRIDHVCPGEFAMEGRVILWAQAPGFAAVMRLVDITPDMPPFELRLGPGRAIRGRIVDPVGKAVAGVTVGSGPGHLGGDTAWQERHFLLMWRTKTDEAGRFTWDHAPDDDVCINYWKEGYMGGRDVKVPPGEEERLFTIRPALRITGRVRDATSGKPVRQFKLIHGYSSDDTPNVSWLHSSAVPFDEGSYECTFNTLRPTYALRIEAEGYEPAESRLFRPDEGELTYDFKLERPTTVAGIVRLPDGTPAGGADVTLVAGSGDRVTLEFSDRLLDERNSRGVRNGVVQKQTDAKGRFSFMLPREPYTIVVMHDEGYADVGGGAFDASGEIVLEPWGRVEGTLRVGTRPGANRRVAVWLHARHEERPSVLYKCTAPTDDKGRFAVVDVPPGDGDVGPLGLVRKTSPSTRLFRLPVEIRPGETTHVDVGGRGRPVTGRIVPPADETRNIQAIVKGLIGTPMIGRRGPDMPPEVREQGLEARRVWRRRWLETQEGKLSQQPPQWTQVFLDDDGSFRADEVPVGTFVFKLHLSSVYGVGPDGTQTSYRIDGAFVMPPIPGGVSDEPLDLGTLVLERHETDVIAALKIGAAAPALEVETLDGNAWRLADQRGKYVLLDFWATWCGPCIREMPYVKEVHQAFGRDKRFVMIGLSLDKKPEHAREYVEKHDLGWIQGFLGDWEETELPTEFGVSSIPAIILVGPDGRIVANHLSGSSIKSTLANVLGRP